MVLIHAFFFWPKEPTLRPRLAVVLTRELFVEGVLEVDWVRENELVLGIEGPRIAWELEIPLEYGIELEIVSGRSVISWAGIEGVSVLFFKLFCRV